MTTLTVEPQATPATEATLTAHDRCDRCGAQAYVRVGLEAGELLFCGHHSRAYAGGYTDKATFIQDETARLRQEFGATR